MSPGFYKSTSCRKFDHFSKHSLGLAFQILSMMKMPFSDYTTNNNTFSFIFFLDQYPTPQMGISMDYHSRKLRDNADDFDKDT